MDKYEELVVHNEVNKCLLCYDAPCQKACPNKIAIASMIQSIRFENTEGAVAKLKECGKLDCTESCEAKYCEKACIYRKIDKPIEVHRIHQYLEEKAKKEVEI